jgi:hypothetical protein
MNDVLLRVATDQDIGGRCQQAQHTSLVLVILQSRTCDIRTGMGHVPPEVDCIHLVRVWLLQVPKVVINV